MDNIACYCSWKHESHLPWSESEYEFERTKVAKQKIQQEKVTDQIKKRLGEATSTVDPIYMVQPPITTSEFLGRNIFV